MRRFSIQTGSVVISPRGKKFRIHTTGHTEDVWGRHGIEKVGRISPLLPSRWQKKSYQPARTMDCSECRGGCWPFCERVATQTMTVFVLFYSTQHGEWRENYKKKEAMGLEGLPFQKPIPAGLDVLMALMCLRWRQRLSPEGWKREQWAFKHICCNVCVVPERPPWVQATGETPRTRGRGGRE